MSSNSSSRYCSIMSVMLSNISERKKEIGIKLAVGATAKDILYEFLLKEITKINDITVELSNKNGNDERLQNRINELNKEKELVSEALKYYE